MADQSSAFVSGVFLGGLVVAVAAYVLCQVDRGTSARYFSGSQRSAGYDNGYSRYNQGYDTGYRSDYDPGYQRRINRGRPYQPIYSTYAPYPRPRRAIRRVAPPPCYMPCGY
jgi:hypothetical protein